MSIRIIILSIIKEILQMDKFANNMKNYSKPDHIEIVLEDGNRLVSDDFVVVTNNDNCEAQLFYSADAVTMGQAIQMISFAYTEMLAKLPEEQANEVREALRSFISMEGDK